MPKEIFLEGEPVIVIHKVSRRARSLRITLHKDGRVVLSRPIFVAEGKAEDFLHKRALWVLKHLKQYKKLTPLIPRYSKKEVELEKVDLLKKVNERLIYLNAAYRFSYNKVSIRNTKTRWGSCSRKGNLQFSFKMKYIPDHLFDYVIVHELCHLKEFNHAQGFWNLVAEHVPNWKELRAELRKVV